MFECASSEENRGEKRRRRCAARRGAADAEAVDVLWETKFSARRDETR